ncbi:zf-HC2 domain-containing protein [Streptomyces sp. NPDC057638]|uniref:zf-HC2 domain-containing protein n=1 Tax=Streptomyces sp. NPDC057638 TaxID=3346190 RepID=UPI00369D33B9
MSDQRPGERGSAEDREGGRRRRRPSPGDHVTLLLGAYVLGALGPDEDERVTGHVRVCDACREECRELAGVPPLLALLARPGVSPSLQEPGRQTGT